VSYILAVNSQRLYGKEEPVKDAAYLRYIRQLSCVACGKHPRQIEAAHFGPRGLGQKSDDRQALPLCHKCHRTSPISYHELGPVKFALAHKLDVAAQIAKLNAFYEEKLKP
jgi:hypothetical protein